MPALSPALVICQELGSAVSWMCLWEKSNIIFILQDLIGIISPSAPGILVGIARSKLWEQKLIVSGLFWRWSQEKKTTTTKPNWQVETWGREGKGYGIFCAIKQVTTKVPEAKSHWSFFGRRWQIGLRVTSSRRWGRAISPLCFSRRLRWHLQFSGTLFRQGQQVFSVSGAQRMEVWAKRCLATHNTYPQVTSQTISLATGKCSLTFILITFIISLPVWVGCGRAKQFP